MDVKLLNDAYLHVLVRMDLIMEETGLGPFPFSAFSNGLNDKCNQAVNNWKDGIRIGAREKTGLEGSLGLVVPAVRSLLRASSRARAGGQTRSELSLMTEQVICSA